jgi:hypothetical protein
MSSTVCCWTLCIVLQTLKLANVNLGLLRLRRKTTHQSGLTHFAVARVWFLRSFVEITVCTRRKIQRFRKGTKEESKFLRFISSSRWQLRFHFSSMMCSLHIVVFCGMTSGWLICVGVVFGFFLQGKWRKKCVAERFVCVIARVPNMRSSVIWIFSVIQFK